MAAAKAYIFVEILRNLKKLPSFAVMNAFITAKLGSFFRCLKSQQIYRKMHVMFFEEMCIVVRGSENETIMFLKSKTSFLENRRANGYHNITHHCKDWQLFQISQNINKYI